MLNFELDFFAFVVKNIFRGVRSNITFKFLIPVCFIFLMCPHVYKISLIRLKLLLSPISPVVSLVSSIYQFNSNRNKPASGSPNFLHLCLHPGIHPVDNPSYMIGSRLEFMIVLCIFPVSKSWKVSYHGDLNEIPPPPHSQVPSP